MKRNPKRKKKAPVAPYTGYGDGFVIRIRVPERAGIKKRKLVEWISDKLEDELSNFTDRDTTEAADLGVEDMVLMVQGGRYIREITV